MVISDVSMIESVGGGSCRCMLVENWSTVNMDVVGVDGHLDMVVNQRLYTKPSIYGFIGGY